MKQEQKVPIIIVTVVVAILLAAGGYLAANPTARNQVLVELDLAEPEAGGITASGFIEAEEVSIAAEVGGRIVEVTVTDGDLVEAEQVLVRLDDTMAQAQVEIARAGLEAAQATLDQVRAGARPEAVRQAEAALAAAEAARDGAYQAWQDTLAMLENPQELDAQIALAEAQLAEAEAGLRQAAAMRDATQIAKDALDRAYEDFPPGERKRIMVASGQLADLLADLPPDLAQFISGLGDGVYTYGDWEIVLSGSNATIYRWVTAFYPLEAALVPNAYWRAWVGYNTAQAAYDGARRALNLLYAMRDDPQQLQAQADAAEAEYRAAEAAVEMARAQLEGLRAGATDEEIAAAEAQVQQAQARLDSALVVLDKLTLTAPVGGQVLEVTGHVGELAVPGATLIVLADLDQVTLTVYVPENRLGEVQVGQQVEVRVDSFPDRIFLGQVATIASEAEFTPRNVQTQEERVNMVFAVKVIIPNHDHALKPGMPADAVILTQEQ